MHPAERRGARLVFRRSRCQRMRAAQPAPIGVAVREVRELRTEGGRWPTGPRGLAISAPATPSAADCSVTPCPSGGWISPAWTYTSTRSPNDTPEPYLGAVRFLLQGQGAGVGSRRRGRPRRFRPTAVATPTQPASDGRNGMFLCTIRTSMLSGLCIPGGGHTRRNPALPGAGFLLAYDVAGSSSCRLPRS